MAPLKVLIIGGGVAGPALAYWLSRIDANITLIERYPTMRAGGQQVDLRAQGVDMMKKMGIEESVRAVTVHESGTQLIDTDGRTKAFFPAMKSNSGKQSLTSEFEIMRGDLVKIIYALTEKCDNVHHLYNTTVESFTQDDESDPNGKVHVTFQDGRKEDFDVVIGADGTGSRTRKMMLGPDAPDPRHRLGGYIGYFSVRSQPGDWDRFTFCFLPGKVARVIGTRKDCAEFTRVYMITTGNDSAIDAAHISGDLEAQKKAWANFYQDAGWQSPRFMKALLETPEADDLYFRPFEEVRLPKHSWSKGRVVVIGDAAHSSTADGFGCTWSLIGAYILAGEIATMVEKEKSSTTAAMLQAMKNYEEKFRPISTAKHGGSQKFESLMFPKSKTGIWALHTFARVAALLKLDQGIGLLPSMGSWKIPEYPALEREQTRA